MASKTYADRRKLRGGWAAKTKKSCAEKKSREVAERETHPAG